MDELPQDQRRALYREASGARWRDVLSRTIPIYLILVVSILLVLTIGGIAEGVPARQFAGSVLIVIAMSALVCVPFAGFVMLIVGQIGRACVLVEGHIAAKERRQVPGRYTPSTAYAWTLYNARAQKINRDGSLSAHRALEEIDVDASDFERVEHGQPFRALCWSSGKLIRVVGVDDRR
jgi:hypothetical protein